MSSVRTLPPLAGYALALGDDALILAQRLGQWVARAPQIEEDVALANIALDLLGQARTLLSYAGRLRQARIRARTLVLHGGADAVVDPRNGRLLADRIPGARLTIFPELGHLLCWEDPDGFARAVTSFLLADPKARAPRPGGIAGLTTPRSGRLSRRRARSS